MARILLILVACAVLPNLLSAQSDSSAVVLMSVAELYAFGSNNQSRITINYPGTSAPEKVIDLERRTTQGNPHINSAKIAEAVNDILLQGFDLVEFRQTNVSEVNYHSTYVFVRRRRQ